MSKLPAFQFYPSDWLGNTKLRRCSLAARGAWMDVLCVLHDSDEYGLIRWPLKELAQASGVPVKVLNELISKNVLKGSDTGIEPYIYQPRSGRKLGDPVELIAKTDKPLWYSSRLVRDNYIRKVRGFATQFTPISESPMIQPNPSPKVGLGAVKSDGPSSSSSTSYNILCVKARDLTCKFFNISEMQNAKTFVAISNAIELIEKNGKLEYYEKQLTAYFEFKKLSQQQICNWSSWLIGEELTIESGHWCRENWEQKLINQKNGNNRSNYSKPEQGTIATRSGQIKDYGDCKL